MPDFFLPTIRSPPLISPSPLKFCSSPMAFARLLLEIARGLNRNPDMNLSLSRLPPPRALKKSML
ncbi:hypothetical protein LINPERPRIM_LOCUS24016 [Linum perenne]